MRTAATTFALVLLVACNSSSSSSSPTAPVTRTGFELRFGASTTVAGTSLRVRFSELAEESRCPKNVQCVWQGNAKIRLDVTSNGVTESVFLNTAGEPQFPRTATAFGHVIELIDLQPYPEEPQPPDARLYVAHLTVAPAP